MTTSFLQTVDLQSTLGALGWLAFLAAVVVGGTT